MINALKYTEELEKAGFTPEQAKKSVDTWMTLINNNFATKSDFREFQFANKSDLRELEIKLEGQIKSVEIKLEGQIKSVEIKLEGQIRDLDAKIEQTSSKIIIQLGALMAVLMTIAVSVMSMIVR